MRSSSIGARALSFLSILAAVGLLCSIALGPGAQAADWTTYNADENATNFSPLDSINKSNVARLGLVWSMDIDEKGVMQGTPLAVNGVVYFSSNRSAVYAVDAQTGKRLWKYDPEIWKHDPAALRYSYGTNRGVAYADGRVFVGGQDGRLIGLDAKTGAVIWSVETTAPGSGLTITGAPRTFNGKVIIGNAYSEHSTRGYVTAFDAATGRQLWRFYTVPGSPEQNKGDPVMERAAKTWTGEFWKAGGGGNVWDAITFDSDLNRIYLGTANAYPWDPHVRNPQGEDNLFTASIVAIDANTGKYVWHYQVNPNDAWDYDAANQITLADLTIDGKARKVLLQAPKNGFFYVIDRKTGKLISAEKFGKVNWAERIDLKTGRPVENKNIRYETGESLIWPSIAGEHDWMSMSYSPVDRLAYIPTMHMSSRFRLEGEKEGKGLLNVSMDKGDPEDGTGALLAWDPVQQKARWKVKLDRAWNGGVMSTAGDLVFQGTPDGYLSAYDGSTGAMLWRFYAGHGILGAPISYSVGDKQYVSVLTGFGTMHGYNFGTPRVGWKFGVQPHRLLTFALDGKEKLPPTPPPDLSVKAIDDPAIQINADDVGPGQGLFRKDCALCHGFNIAAGAPAPDLRESQIALKRENLWNILHDGALIQLGMPQFPELTESQVGQIYAFIRNRARETLAGPQPPAQ